MKKIIQLGDERLRIVCEAIPEPHITDPQTETLLRDLSDALASQKDGVAISAPQIGVTQQVFVIGGIVFDEAFQKGISKTVDPNIPNQYFINPRIVRESQELCDMDEGCLSVRGVYGSVTRPCSIVLEYFNEQGERKSQDMDGFLARVVQHEYDHLHGILFIDKAHELWQDDNYKQL